MIDGQAWVYISSVTFDFCFLCSQMDNKLSKVCPQCIAQQFPWDEQFVDAAMPSHLNDVKCCLAVIVSQAMRTDRLNNANVRASESHCFKRYPLMQLACVTARLAPSTTHGPAYSNTTMCVFCAERQHFSAVHFKGNRAGCQGCWSCILAFVNMICTVCQGNMQWFCTILYYVTVQASICYCKTRY